MCPINVASEMHCSVLQEVKAISRNVYQMYYYMCLKGLFLGFRIKPVTENFHDEAGGSPSWIHIKSSACLPDYEVYPTPRAYDLTILR